MTDTIAYHGGAFWDAIGADFSHIDRHHTVIAADVMDAWFDPTPLIRRTLSNFLDWSFKTSPPTHCEGLIDTISTVRGVARDAIVVGAGSSDLMFRALVQLCHRAHRALVITPSYGEYPHILQHLVGCHLHPFALSEDNDFHIDPTALIETIHTERIDWVFLVNPNNPTGHALASNTIQSVVLACPNTQFWIDETYIDYIGAEHSLERWASEQSRVFVLKSMSKVYALSGCRVAYLVARPDRLETIARHTPPWCIPLSSQIAATLALGDPEYYRQQYQQTTRLKEQLIAAVSPLKAHIISGQINSILCRLNPDGPDANTVVYKARKRDVFLRHNFASQCPSQPYLLRISVQAQDKIPKIVAAILG